MKLLLIIKSQEDSLLCLKHGNTTIDELHLTISQGFDKLLITAIDNLLARNKIDRLSLKSLEIRGKLNEGVVSMMILRAVSSAIGV